MASYHVEIRDFPRNAAHFNMSGPEVGNVLLSWAQQRTFELGGQRWNPETAEITVIEGPEIPIPSLSLGRGWPTAVREGQDVTNRVLAEAREAIVDGSVARMTQAQEAQAAAQAREAEAPSQAAPEPAAAQDAAAEALPAQDAVPEAFPGEGAPPQTLPWEGDAPGPAPLDEASGEAALAGVEGGEADQLALGVELAALLGADAARLLAAWREVAARASGLSPSESLALAERQLRDR